MDDILAHIKHKSAYLHQNSIGDLPPYLSLFGPYSNPRVGVPLSEQEVAAFEAQHQIRLPEDYRRFIMEIGAQDYILQSGFSPLGDYHPLLSAPFPFNKTVLYEERDNFVKDNPTSLGGYLPIIYTGCVCFYSVIITGEERGHIWHVDDNSLFAPVYLADRLLTHHDNGGEVDLKTPADAQRLTFTQWYDAKLDEYISALQSYLHQQGRDLPPLTFD